jgi:nicotinate-nucleotide--dimethylbenzimidazole phosphoribosyltransferase
MSDEPGPLGPGRVPHDQGVRPSPAGAFPPAARQAVYDAIRLRRDVRSFRPHPVPADVLRRVLEAAHRAGSVGNMQPWDFVLVRSAEQKARVYALFRDANERAATRFEGDRARTYLALKLQGVLDAPLGVCVTCDTARGGPHVLGRDTLPETDRYSTCLAVQNLWLAARAEGVGVGWVSIVDHDALGRVLGLPPHVVPVAYLCLGYPVEFAPEPMLEQSGWRGRLPLDDLIHEDRWGRRATASAVVPVDAASPAVPPAATGLTVESLRAAVVPADPGGARAVRVRARLDELAKPPGSLGRLEALAVRLSCAQGQDWPESAVRRVLVFAGDHGVAREDGVSAYRTDVTARLCYTLVAGGATLNALLRPLGVVPEIVDVGVDHDFAGAPGVVHAKVRRGTRNLAREHALTRGETEAAILAGARAVLAGPRPDVLALGEVGIGNSTAAAALAALLTGSEAGNVVGAGTGVRGATARRKLAAVEHALARARAAGLGGAEADPVDQLAAVGGAELAAITGAVLAGAVVRATVVLDGFIVGAAALSAARLAPVVTDYLVAAHRSAEPGHERVLGALGLDPLLDLGLRLGEGSGAALALPLVDAACAVLRDVRTFAEAGIDAPLDPRADA